MADGARPLDAALSFEENRRHAGARGSSSTLAMKKPTKREREAARKKHLRLVRENIEKQEVLREIQLKSFLTVRLSRIKYKGIAKSFIDIRVFSRGYDSEGEEKYYPTRRGIHMWESDFTQLVESQFFGAIDAQIRKDPR